MKYQIFGEKEVKNIPWQERPSGCSDTVWRFDANPIIERDIIPCSNSVFNSAAVPFEDGFAGVFRVDNRAILRPRLPSERNWNRRLLWFTVILTRGPVRHFVRLKMPR